MPSELNTTLGQMRSNALLLRAVRICAEAPTLKEGRVALADFIVNLSFYESEDLTINVIECLTIKMAADCSDRTEFLKTLDVVGTIIDKVTEQAGQA